MNSIRDDDFQDQVINSDIPVLVDFWAEWCWPCKLIQTTIDELAHEYAGRIAVTKMCIDSNKTIASRLKIKSLPTVILFDKGRMVKQFVGVKTKADYAEAMDKILDKN